MACRASTSTWRCQARASRRGVRSVGPRENVCIAGSVRSEAAENLRRYGHPSGKPLINKGFDAECAELTEDTLVAGHMEQDLSEASDQGPEAASADDAYLRSHNAKQGEEVEQEA